MRGGPAARHDFTVRADHFQFYLEDLGARADTSAIWEGEAQARGLAVGPGLLAVGTARYGGAVRVVVEVREGRPTEALDPWNRVVEASLDAPTGELVLLGPELVGTPDLPGLRVPPGTYGALVCSGGLATVGDEQARGGGDHYRIVLWPGPAAGPVVLKG